MSAPRSFGTPGPLAVAPNGALYVASGRELYEMRDERLVPFVSAHRTILSTVAGDGGTVYLGESDALQSVSPSGVVATVARVGVGGLGSGPSGAIYVVVNNAIERLAGHKLVLVAKAAKFNGLSGVPTAVGGELGLGSVVADGKGDLYVSGEGVGFNLYELTATGKARFVSPFRGANGKPAPLSVGPQGVVYGEWQNAIYEADGGGILPYQGFQMGTVPEVTGVFLPAFIAASTHVGSPLYADSTGGNGFGGSGIIAIYRNHHIVTLWSG